MKILPTKEGLAQVISVALAAAIIAAIMVAFLKRYG